VKAKVRALDGKANGEVELPRQFTEEYRPELIRRAFHAEQSLHYQPKGTMKGAGMDYTTAEYFGRRHRARSGINIGRARLPREKIAGGFQGRVLKVPQARKGRRSHPPKPYKILIEKINYKEKCKAIRSAITATCDLGLVQARGHLFKGNAPIVVEDSFEEIKRVKDAIGALEKLGITNDLERAKNGRRMRSGRARLRKGGYRQPVTALVVYKNDKGVWKAMRNIPGVDCVKVSELNADLLAPGGQAGRLTVWTVSALKELGNQELYCA